LPLLLIVLLYRPISCQRDMIQTSQCAKHEAEHQQAWLRSSCCTTPPGTQLLLVAVGRRILLTL
jgi:hypothetical protein